MNVLLHLSMSLSALDSLGSLNYSHIFLCHEINGRSSPPR